MTDPAKNKPTRRDLLTGSLANKTGSANDQSLVSNSERNDTSKNRKLDSVGTKAFGPLFHISANAMGCEFQILSSQIDQKLVSENAVEAFQLIESLEQQLSIYRPTSEMAMINNLAGSESSDGTSNALSLEPQLFQLLKLANEISRITGGAFDITATRLSQVWKQHRKLRTLPDQEEIEKALTSVGYGRIVLNDSDLSIRIAPSHSLALVDGPPLQIDLGGIGKGYALDRVTYLLLHFGCKHLLIHGGQSSVAACGQRANRNCTENNDARSDWTIGISHPLTPGIRLATVRLRDQAIGTSGSGRQSFVFDGKRYGHIIDPRTGWPADHFLSVTVIAEQAVLADALATAIFVAGKEQAQAICDHYHAAAVLISECNSPSGVEVETINLSDESIQLAD